MYKKGYIDTKYLALGYVGAKEKIVIKEMTGRINNQCSSFIFCLIGIRMIKIMSGKTIFRSRIK